MNRILRKTRSLPTLPLVLLTVMALAACGGDDNPDATAPDAPVIGDAIATDAGASVAFAAPSSDGGATITIYTATCSNGTDASTGTASTSPITVTALTNNLLYTCSVTATNSVGTSVASGDTSVTPMVSGGGSGVGGSGTSTTAGVQCDYNYSELNMSASVNLTSTADWSCTNTERVLAANGVPDHDVGTFPNTGNPNTISEQSVSANYSLTPVQTDTATELGGPRGATGYVLNGVKIDASTAGSCNDAGDSCSLIDNSGSWSIEALTNDTFDFGADENNAHVQPDGSYHYHGMPEGFITKQGGNSSTMTLIGWAADGFPIYARYGYAIADQAGSSLKVITSSYQLVAVASTSRPSTVTYPLGTFRQDWEYVEGLGDLDECNGRVGVTPEFPNGIYHYFATDTYPYFQRCVKGEVTAAGGGQPPPPAGG